MGVCRSVWRVEALLHAAPLQLLLPARCCLAAWVPRPFSLAVLQLQRVVAQALELHRVLVVADGDDGHTRLVDGLQAAQKKEGKGPVNESRGSMRGEK